MSGEGYQDVVTRGIIPDDRSQHYLKTTIREAKTMFSGINPLKTRLKRKETSVNSWYGELLFKDVTYWPP